MKLRSAFVVAVPVALAFTLWAATAMSVPVAPAPPTAQPAPTGNQQVVTLDQRRIAVLEDQVKAHQTELTALRAELNALKVRTSQAETAIRPLQSHTHTYEVENLGGMNLATIQAHPNNVLIATKPNSQQGGPTISKTSSGPKN